MALAPSKTHQNGHGIPARDPNKNYENQTSCLFLIYLLPWEWLEMAGNDLKRLEMLQKGITMAGNGTKYLAISGKSWTWLEMIYKLM